MVANRIADALGRRTTMVLIAIGFALFALLQGVASTIAFLDISRFLLGVAIGVSTVAAPVFIAESAPARIRGALVVGYQVATVVGIMVAYFVNYGLADGGHWRLMLGLSAVPAVLVLLALLRPPGHAALVRHAGAPRRGGRHAPPRRPPGRPRAGGRRDRARPHGRARRGAGGDASAGPTPGRRSSWSGSGSLISRFFLTVFEDLGGTATFAIFLGLTVVSFGFIAALAPETKGRPLEAIRLFWENGGKWPDARAEKLAAAAAEQR